MVSRSLCASATQPRPITPARADANARPATKADVEAHFATHGTGEITEIKLMNGFGFIEYKDAMDARDVVPGELSHHFFPAITGDCLLTTLARLSFPYVDAITPWKYRPSYPASLANDMLKMDPTLWANVSRSSSRAAPATANRPPAPAPLPAEDTTTIATAPQGRAARRIACKSVDFPMIPAGRSVKLSHFVFHRHSYWIHPLEGLERAISLAPMD
jgi:hypothetical protein